jgi:hypothetical protein
MPSKKRYPVQRKMNIDQPGPAANILRIDAPKFLSQINHRLYRQSRAYECKVDVHANVADGTTVEVYALADTWYLTGALKLAKSAWDASNSEEIMMNNGKLARWNDFRVTNTIATSGAGRVNQYSKGALVETAFTAGEFEDSIVVDQAGVSRTFTVGIATPSSYDIIAQYNEQSGTSADPQFPSTSPYDGLLPNLDAAAAAAISDSGNLPPYAQAGYPNAIWVKVGTLRVEAGRQRLSTGFFSAPMGMIVLTGVGALGDTSEITLECKTGDYKGVMANSMLE